MTKDENDIKEKLQNEVTKIKEGLENFLSESNRIIKANDIINKGLNKFGKENEKGILKTLSYISKMNKNKKETQVLLQELMKNLKICFEEEKTNVAYSDYYFNGIPSPKEIKVKDITFNSAILSWNIDKLNIFFLKRFSLLFSFFHF